MTETLNFTYKSIGNFVRLLSTVKYEQTHNPREIAIWHERFDNDESDNLFETFLKTLFPEGGTIDVEHIEQLIKYIDNWLDKDEETRQIRNKYIKLDNPYWVYFKIDDIVTPCRFGDHARIVEDICLEYFKDCENVSENKIRRFILDNFEIRSDNTDISRIANDAPFIISRLTREKLYFRNISGGKINDC